MTLKYVTAGPWVSGLEPLMEMIWLEKATDSTDSTRQAMTVNTIAVTRISLAFFLSS